MKANLSPDQLDLEEALRRLFPGFNPDEFDPEYGTHPLRGPKWRAGTRPKRKADDPAAALFDKIDEAAQARDRNDRRETSLLSVSGLASQGIACPYFYSLLGVAYAADRARRQILHSEANTNGHDAEWRDRLEDKANEAAETLSDFLAEWTPQMAAIFSTHSGQFGHSISGARLREDREQSIELFSNIRSGLAALEKIRDAARRERSQYIKSGKRDVWHTTFAVGIGKLWFELTGREPSAKSLAFSGFLSSAFSAIGGNRQEWTSTIRTADRAAPPPAGPIAGNGIVPRRHLLRYEVGSNADLSPHAAAVIIRALDGAGEIDEGAAAIDALQETENLPLAIDALVSSVKWTLADELAELGARMGADPETIASTLAGLAGGEFIGVDAAIPEGGLAPEHPTEGYSQHLGTEITGAAMAPGKAKKE